MLFWKVFVGEGTCDSCLLFVRPFNLLLSLIPCQPYSVSTAWQSVVPCCDGVRCQSQTQLGPRDWPTQLATAPLVEHPFSITNTPLLDILQDQTPEKWVVQIYWDHRNWKKYCMTVRLYTYMTVWLYNSMTVQLYTCMPIWLYNCMTIQLYTCMHLWLYDCFTG